MHIEGLDLMAGGKRDDPTYLQISGYVPKEVGLQFKATCTLQEVSQSEALEEAIQEWLAKVKALSSKAK